MIRFSQQKTKSTTSKITTNTRRSTRTKREPERFDPSSNELVTGGNKKQISYDKIDNYDMLYDGNSPENIHIMIQYKSGWAIKEDEDFELDEGSEYEDDGIE